MQIRFLDHAPPEAVGPAERLAPIRRPEGFTPAVQRWSFLLPPGCAQFRLAFLAVQAADEAALAASDFLAWAGPALSGTHAPSTLDHARYHEPDGRLTHVIAAYWLDEVAYQAWRAATDPWWEDSARLAGPTGVWREILRIPRERQESIFWRDYPAAMMTAPEVEIFPTPYCGYYGAMRDRIPAAAVDPLDAPEGAALERHEREGRGARWRITAPHNLAVIRSANSWGAMDAEQHADYLAKLRGPLERGMDFLRDQPLPSGCASLRMQRKTDLVGHQSPEDHALGHFLSLRHMERWAEGHSTHAAIFGAAIARYKRYGAQNQLRTWHEVYVLPEGDQLFEYVNCAPGTGLLPWFEGERLG